MSTERDGIDPDELEQTLQRYHAAIEAEFAASAAVADGTKELEATIREFFKNEATASAARIVWLANNAYSEAIQFACSKYVLQEGLQAALADKEDPISVLLKQLHATTPTKQRANINSNSENETEDPDQ